MVGRFFWLLLDLLADPGILSCIKLRGYIYQLRELDQFQAGVSVRGTGLQSYFEKWTFVSALVEGFRFIRRDFPSKKDIIVKNGVHNYEHKFSKN